MSKRLPVQYKPIDEISDVFDVLTPEQKTFLRSHYTVCTLKKNEFVHREGETPTHLFCLKKGKIKITKKGIGEKVQIVRMIKPVHFTGYRAIFAEDSYTTSGMAVESLVVYLIEKEAFLELITQNAQFSRYFLKRLALDLGNADARAVTLTQKHIRGRLADSLCMLIDSYGYEEDGITLSVYLSREDLACHSNMTVANAIRTLSAFAKEKLLTVDGRIIKVIDEDKLRHISKFG
ncbi:MAG: Crp/Fnr family transcriptional regulator [Prevotellaceae bacterium]|jgi:CRP-like cAMP-binding protein|nr:Crp/Fnr family transcriptional regulator [Prevotellaceae bacterium]